MRSLTVIAVLLLLAPIAVMAADRQGEKKCAHCGATGCCLKPVCKVHCEMKEVKKTVYDKKCEDFCVPGRSTKCKECNDGSCDSCRKKCVRWIPGCAQVFTRSKLVKYEVKEKKPHYSWSVEYVCPTCACKCKEEASHDGSPVPAAAAPAPSASLEQSQEMTGPVAEVEAAPVKPAGYLKLTTVFRPKARPQK